MDIDTALATVGGYRRWHLMMLVLLGYSMFFPLAWQGLSIVFIGWTPPHHCKIPVDGANISDYIPLVEGQGGEMELDKCSMYKVVDNKTISNKTTKCPAGWTYDTQGYNTIVNEFDLVCEANFLAELSQSAYQLVALFAEILMAWLIDRVGRKKIHIIGLMMVAVIGGSTAASPNYATFACLKALNALAVVASLKSGLILCMELFDEKMKAVAGIGLEFPWVTLYSLLPLLAYLLTEWRHLQLFLSLTCLPWIVYIWVLPESVMWLVAKGRYDEAEEILHKMARWNGVKLANKAALKLDRPDADLMLQEKAASPIYRPDGVVNNNVPDMHVTPHGGATEEEDLRVTDLVKDPKLRKHCILMSVLWFGNNLVYYGIILSTPSLAGDRFINFLLTALVEIPSYAVALVLAKYFRRWPICVFHVIAGVALVAVGFIPIETSDGTSLTVLITVVALIGKFSISVTFALIVLYNTELFPTPLRGTGNGLAMVLGRVGNMIAPVAAYAAKELAWLPNVLMAVISVIAGIAVLFLPETVKFPLPQTLRDIYRFYDQEPPPRGGSTNKQNGRWLVGDDDERI